MGCTEDIHGIITEIDDDGCTVAYTDAFDEPATYWASDDQYDLGYRPCIRDRVVIAWFGNDEEPVLRLEALHG